MSDYERFAAGNVRFPLEVASGRTLLRDADPAIFHALAFFEHTLETYVGARITEAAVAANVASITKAVGSTCPVDPAPLLTSAQVRFPLLAVYRKELVFEQARTSFRRKATVFEVVYVLPPLTAGEREKLEPILNAVVSCLDDRAELGMDPSFTPEGGAQGDTAWCEVRGGIEKWEFKRASFGDFPASGDLYMPCVVLQAEVRERQKWETDQFSAFSSTSTEILEGAGPNQEPATVLESEWLDAAEIASVTPTTGAAAGGTTIALVGERFRAGDRVFLGDLECVAVSVAPDGTSITCVTPESPAGVFDVRVLSHLGQASTLAAAFTVTA